LIILKEDYLNNKKVQRWIRASQGYDFDLVCIKGSDNYVADAFSRLCAISEVTYLGHTINSEGIHFSREKLEGVMKYSSTGNSREFKVLFGGCEFLSRSCEGLRNSCAATE
jgi:hypothetical protein